ncbi:CoA-transferase family III [Rhodococcoides kyotonense]|uniref:CoA-transferase family III n=1 Tax=Rhodococcoides kyotonense TaxID=398843 RepID=A0A239M202_9NOCA|nr:CoA-transferase family III [Rhodococcus kyotonensis]
MIRASDGWTVLSCARPDDHALLGAMIGVDMGDRDPWTPVEAWAADHTSAELDTRVELLGLAGGVVHDAEPTPSVVPNLEARVRSVVGAVLVDFSALWAGPLCAHLLGLAGARVIKVETPQRPDGARGGNQQFYDLLHAGHESVVLDPSVPSDRGALLELVERADIIVEASRPRALQRFGLHAAEFVDKGAIWVSITARGRSIDRIGFGDDIAASSGLVARDQNGDPLFVGDAIADPLTGLTAAAAVFSTAPGHGRLIDLSMSDVVRSTLGPVAHSEASTPRPPRHRISAVCAPASGADTTSVLSDFGIQ